jgi:hypothetical protein
MNKCIFILGLFCRSFYNKQLIRKKFEEEVIALLQVLARNLPGGTEEYH